MERFIYVPKKDVETALVMIKPDSYKNKLIGEVIDRLLQLGFKITYMNMGWLNDDAIGILYKDAKEKMKSIDFDNMIKFMKSTPVVTMLIEGKNAITDAEKFRGPTMASTIIPGTIRELREHPFDSNNYDKALDYRNILHWTRTPDEASKDSELIINTLRNAEEDFAPSGAHETNFIMLNPMCYFGNLFGILIDEFCKMGDITTLQMGYLPENVIRKLNLNIKSDSFLEYMKHVPIISMTVQGRKVVENINRIIAYIENNKRVPEIYREMRDLNKDGIGNLLYSTDNVTQAKDNYSLVKRSLIYR